MAQIKDAKLGCLEEQAGKVVVQELVMICVARFVQV